MSTIIAMYLSNLLFWQLCIVLIVVAIVVWLIVWALVYLLQSVIKAVGAFVKSAKVEKIGLGGIEFDHDTPRKAVRK